MSPISTDIIEQEYRFLREYIWQASSAEIIALFLLTDPLGVHLLLLKISSQDVSSCFRGKSCVPTRFSRKSKESGFNGGLEMFRSACNMPTSKS